ncbi:imidazole glycerol phosphate synthase subunit HisF [Candidatus Blochmannia ocreatus (nom. nud.)]|uniref:Imidazole glycerol phosphate synthase subunit HisF n=1 Tax=Candidatus Blochmannia ocreatus (nom. nud.) TaxID=251538 RepID=A0ABY4SVZ5_9ENTR|nr:imidazole glycerol phosphate synthase subunit HisF [Candidatus Blochmannia ocreatus]URJ24961.1 imidazole glycerol phosphate synthase subunit HisF [Candidatus Blochmannia ocreatus]
MLAKRIIPCLDVIDNKVIKGIQFKKHTIIGDIVDLANRYAQEGADELVFYDITASPHKKIVDKKWITRVAKVINIPFCVAGGITTLEQAKQILESGADKISINSPALINPALIKELSENLGKQCVVISIDIWKNTQKDDSYQIQYYTGDSTQTCTTTWEILDWIKTIQEYGAGEIVLNMMNQDGMKIGYNLELLKYIRQYCKVPLIASGGAGTAQHFLEAFRDANVDGALAASVFHKKIININKLKYFLTQKGIQIRLC